MKTSKLTGLGSTLASLVCHLKKNNLKAAWIKHKGQNEYSSFQLLTMKYDNLFKMFS